MQEKHVVFACTVRNVEQYLPTLLGHFERCGEKFASWRLVVSPFGNGFDCHRTWEALVLGCIPIVRTSGLDPLYEGLPVLIVDNWSDVSKELLERTFQYERLQLAYWMNRIRNGS
jgi:hypothetical protein